MIKFHCEKCGVVLQVPDENAGKKGKCPKCGVLFTIPYASAGEPAPHVQAPYTPPAPSYAPPPAPAYAPPPAPAYVPPPPAPAYAPPPSYTPPEPQPQAYSAPPSAPVAAPATTGTAGQKPFLLVWVVFFWVITALSLMFIGASLMGSFAGFMAESSMRSRIRGFDADELTTTANVVQIIGGLVFHLGLFTLAVCYGLWTARPWTVIAGRVLSLVFLGLSIAALIFMIIGKAFVISSVFAIVAFGLVVVYFFAGKPLGRS